RHDATDKRKRHIHQHEASIQWRTKRPKEQRKNHGDGHRQNEHEALARTLQVLKLAAPHHLIPLRQLDRRLEASLGFGDKPALITAADVHADGDLLLILSSRNNTGAIDDFNIRQLGKGNASAIRCCYQDIAEVSRVFACLWEVAQRNIKPSL